MSANDLLPLNESIEILKVTTTWFLHPSMTLNYFVLALNQLIQLLLQHFIGQLEAF